MRVHRDRDLGPAVADRLEGPHHGTVVVALGEPLAVEDPSLDQHPVREQEPVGGEEVDGGPRRDPLQQAPQHPCGGGLPHGHAAGDADDRSGRPWAGARGHPVRDPPGQRDVDVDQFVGIDRLPGGDGAGRRRCPPLVPARRPSSIHRCRGKASKPSGLPGSPATPEGRRLTMIGRRSARWRHRRTSWAQRTPWTTRRAVPPRPRGRAAAAATVEPTGTGRPG